MTKKWKLRVKERSRIVTWWSQCCRPNFRDSLYSSDTSVRFVIPIHRTQFQLSLLPLRNEKWVVAYGLRGEGLVWLIGTVVCLLAPNRGSKCLLRRAMNGRIVRSGSNGSCQSAATVRRFWSSVRSDIASAGHYLYLYRVSESSNRYILYSSQK